MKNESLEGCPRCGDYDKIKDELESNKRKSQEEQKSALKRCEDSKKQLQKKLMTIGAVAIVAGTILGKDFVDKIASYIDSFNSVKDGASKLVGQADPPITTPPTEVAKEDTTEEIDDAFVLVPAPRTVDMSMWPAGTFIAQDSPLDDFIRTGSTSFDLIDVITSTTLDMQSLRDDLMIEPMGYSSILYDLTNFGSTVPVSMIGDDYNSPYTEPQTVRAVIVPSTNSLAVFTLPFFMRSRKRNAV